MLRRASSFALAASRKSRSNVECPAVAVAHLHVDAEDHELPERNQQLCEAGVSRCQVGTQCALGGRLAGIASSGRGSGSSSRHLVAWAKAWAAM